MVVNDRNDPARRIGRGQWFVAAALLIATTMTASTAASADARITAAAIESLLNGNVQSALAVIDRRPESFVSRFYGARQHRPAWTRTGDIDTLLRAIRSVAAHGLKPADYHLQLLERLLSEAPRDAIQEAERDLALSAAAGRLLRHVRFGKVNPSSLDPDWNFTAPSEGIDLATELAAAMDAGRLEALFERVQNHNPYYLTLKTALRSHRELASTGGWPMMPDGATLRPGMTDPRVQLLRTRLRMSGDYTGIESGDVRFFDPGLAEAVKSFQHRHGIEPDGVVGRNTLAALNVPVEERIDQLRVNLERARWVLRDPDRDFIVVNIAGYYVEVVREGAVAWEQRVIVGKSYHRTPVFRGEMNHVVFNPDWTVPTSIVVNEFAPEMMRDPTYLQRGNFYLRDGRGNVLDPRSVDWARVARSGPDFTVIQRPGEDNALGRVKFMFPNRHAVYLHDTPSHDLFDRTERAFSHGCIRVERPLELASLLLGNDPRWNVEAIESVIAEGETTRVDLMPTLPVLVLYWTVDPDLNGNVRFYPDIYGRDEAVLRALNAIH